MILFWITNIIILAVSFVFWGMDTEYYSVPFIIFSVYPTFLLLTVMVFRKKIMKYRFWAKITPLLFFTLLWIIGMNYIYKF